jgi:drug/metabolite transporter (DMT)-like permease
VTTASTLLALLCSLLYGTGDFALGIASRANTVFGTTFAFQSLGLLPPIIILAITHPAMASEHALLAGVAGGGCLAVGGFLFVAALSKGNMGVIAPVTAVGAAGVPAVVGLLRGERPSLIALAGMVSAGVGLVLVTTDRSQPLSAGGVPEALGAALGFGGLFVFLRQGESGGWWTIGMSRLVVVVTTALIATALRRSVAVKRSNLPLLATAAALTTFAAAAFLFAQHHSQLAVTAVLASLYPAVTCFLAAYVLGERLNGRQRSGAFIVLASAVCIAVP